MKTYIFTVSSWPGSAFHQPLNARIVLSDSAVVSGTATAADILSFTMTAGAAIPASHPITHANLHSGFLNPTLTLSADRKSIVSFAADRFDGYHYDFWVFFESFHQVPSVGSVENVIELHANRIEVETDFIPPGPIHFSQFGGDWKLQEEKESSHLKPRLQYMAVDPLALMLSNDVYVKINLPNPPPFETVLDSIREGLDRMSPKERDQVLSKVAGWKAFAEKFEKEFGKRKRRKGE